MCGGFGSLGKNLLFVDTGKINTLVGVFVCVLNMIVELGGE